MPHSDHYHSTTKHGHHGHHGHKNPRSKDKDQKQPNGWSGKMGEKAQQNVKELQKPTPMLQNRLWSKWHRGDEERSWFWQARQTLHGKWEYQFTRDFSTIYQEESSRVQPTAYQMSMSQMSAALIGKAYTQAASDNPSVSFNQQAPFPSKGSLFPRENGVNAEAFVSNVTMDACATEQLPAEDTCASKPRKEHKHSHQKPHKHPKKIGSVVKSEKNIKFDSQSIVENWQVDWSDEG